MKLTYWFAERYDASACYSIVDKTKRGAQAKREAMLSTGTCDIGPVVKRTIIAADCFELMERLTGENGGRGYSNVAHS